MGSLKPGAKYIYEHADGVTYAREFGSKERFEIGRTLEKQKKDNALRENKFWSEVIDEAQTNPVLQKAVERVKIIYELSKKDGKE